MRDIDKEIARLTADLLSAFVSNNKVTAEELPILVRKTYDAFSAPSNPPEPSPALPLKLQPAVPVRASIGPDYLICLEDGRKLKTMKRYLENRYGLSPDEYRRKWNLPPSYPMIAPDYAERRSAIAKQSGLGHAKIRQDAETPDD